MKQEFIKRVFSKIKAMGLYLIAFSGIVIKIKNE